MRLKYFSFAVILAFSSISISRAESSSDQSLPSAVAAKNHSDSARPVATTLDQVTGEEFTYEIIDGWGVVGDIVLGKHDELQKNGFAGFGLLNDDTVLDLRPYDPEVEHANIVAHAKKWTNGVVPYQYAPNFPEKKRQMILPFHFSQP